MHLFHYFGKNNIVPGRGTGLLRSPRVAGMTIGFGFFVILCFLPSFASASTNISATVTQHWAWNDAVGWIDFYSTGNVNVSSSQLTGYATSSVGYVSVDCGTAPSWGCSPTNYKVTNDGLGNLGGWAWNDEVGWISFYWGNPTADPTSPGTRTAMCISYGFPCGVYIQSDGSFHGYAWSDTIGYISFNCQEPGFCGTAQYSVVSSWVPVALPGILDSETYDTGIPTGVELNSVIWHGSLNGLLPGAVGFQFAASTSTTGPWTFTGPSGTTSTSDIYVGTGNPDSPIPIINYPAYSGFRYFRYRIILTPNSTQTVSPRVSGVSVDWSP